MTLLDQSPAPPLRPLRYPGKIAMSCHRPRVFLIRAWTVSYRSPNDLVAWICHHVGRLDMADLEWWGFTYPGQPSYMGGRRGAYESGLTIQRYVPETDTFLARGVEEGRYPLRYGPPEPLEIPERGIIVAPLEAEDPGRPFEPAGETTP